MSYCEKYIRRTHCQLLLQLHVVLVLGTQSADHPVVNSIVK
jgi:hypothetical protein